MEDDRQPHRRAVHAVPEGQPADQPDAREPREAGAGVGLQAQPEAAEPGESEHAVGTVALVVEHQRGAEPTGIDPVVDDELRVVPADRDPPSRYGGVSRLSVNAPASRLIDSAGFAVRSSLIDRRFDPRSGATEKPMIPSTDWPAAAGARPTAARRAAPEPRPGPGRAAPSRPAIAASQTLISRYGDAEAAGSGRRGRREGTPSRRNVGRRSSPTRSGPPRVRSRPASDGCAGALGGIRETGPGARPANRADRAAQRGRRGGSSTEAATRCIRAPPSYDQRFHADSTAFGYSGCPRLPL